MSFLGGHLKWKVIYPYKSKISYNDGDESHETNNAICQVEIGDKSCKIRIVGCPQIG